MKRHSGFGLIELMIVVVVIGILAAIAYPSYRDSVLRSNRAGAKNTMLQIAQQEERYYTENNKYGMLTALGYAASPIYSDRNTHAVTLAAGSSGVIGSSYIITATPQSADPACGNLTLTNTGIWSNSAGAPAGHC